jgi:ribosomal protein S18 acetylase RimI-like enzyme
MIRKATKDDIPRILILLGEVNKIHADARPDIFKRQTKYDDKDLKACLEKPGIFVFVADEEGVVAGYLIGFVHDQKDNSLLADRRYFYVDNFCVDSAYRKQGIGHELFRQATITARENLCTSLELNVWELNPDAKAFYLSLGMKPQRTEMEYPIFREKKHLI